MKAIVELLSDGRTLLPWRAVISTVLLSLPSMRHSKQYWTRVFDSEPERVVTMIKEHGSHASTHEAAEVCTSTEESTHV